jgi:uncharacterized tellurite resistance protein B-like protein
MAIFDVVRAFLHRNALARDARGEVADLELRVATVALLLETAWRDADFEPREQRAILRGVEREFGISHAAAEVLVSEAERARREASDSRPFAARLAERYDREQRRRIAALVWKVVYADLVVDPSEVDFATRIVEQTGLTPAECQAERERSFAWFSENRPARGANRGPDDAGG